MSAPLTGVQIFSIVLVDYEAWRYDLDTRGISGPAKSVKLYGLGTGGFFIRSEPRADRGDEGGESAILRSEPRNMLPMAIAFCPQWMLWPAVSPWAWWLLYAGFFSSWLGGLRLGLFATAMSTRSSGIFFLPRERPLKVADPFECSGVPLPRSGRHPQPLPRADEKSQSPSDQG